MVAIDATAAAVEVGGGMRAVVAMVVAMVTIQQIDMAIVMIAVEVDSSIREREVMVDYVATRASSITGTRSTCT